GRNAGRRPSSPPRDLIENCGSSKGHGRTLAPTNARKTLKIVNLLWDYRSSRIRFGLPKICCTLFCIRFRPFGVSRENETRRPKAPFFPAASLFFFPVSPPALAGPNPGAPPTRARLLLFSKNPLKKNSVRNQGGPPPLPQSP